MLLRRTLAALALLVALVGPAPAQSLTWGLGGLGGNSGAPENNGLWDNGTSANWYDGANNVVWAAGNTAVFGGTAGTVTVSGAIAGINGFTFNTTGYTISGGTSLTLTANAIAVGAGNTAVISTPLAGTVGLNLTSGTLNLSGATAATYTLTGTYTVAAGAKLIFGDNFAANGNATVINGTLDLTSPGVNGGTNRYFTNLTGNGVINADSSVAGTGANVRITSGDFAGTMTDGSSGTNRRLSLAFQGPAGIVNLSGANTYTGDTIIRGNGTLRLSNAAALSASTYLRFETGAGNSATLELTTASGDFFRPVGGSTGAGGTNYAAGTNYLAAFNSDRKFGFGVNEAAAAAATLTWGTTTGFAPTIFGFGSVNAANRLTFVNPLNGNAAARTFDVVDGPAAVEGLFAGLVNNFGVTTKTGNGAVQFDAGLQTAGYRFRFGTVILNGGASTSTAYTSIGEVATNVATLTIQGSAGFTQTGDFNVSDVANTRGTLNINTTGTVQINGNSFFGKTSAVGVVNMTAGTMNLTNTLIVGSAGTAAGVLNITGGTINQTAGGEGGAGGLTTGNPSAYGYINMTGGTFNIGGPNFQNSGPAFQVGKYGIGVLDQTGGTLTTGLWTDSARYPGSFGLINVFTGATFNQNSTVNRLFVGEQGRGYINLFAGGTIFAKGGTTIGNDANGSGILNLLGGTYTTQYIVRVNTSPEGRVYLNGATVKPTATNANWINTLSSMTIGAAGGTIDTAGFDVAITQALSGPTGAGVTTIPVTSGGSGYLGRPIINITGGGGSGATAIANLTGGVVTSVTITNPGNDYTSAPTLSLIGGGVGNGAGVPVVAAVLGTPTFATNPVDGGLIKSGTGVLTLSGVNTFTGPLTLSAGTLAVPTINDNATAGPLGAQSDASGLVFAGGALRYTGASVTSTGRAFSASGANPVILDVSSAAANLTLAGTAPTTANAFTKLGAGVLTLNFASQAGFSGVYNANAGILSPVGTIANTFNVNTGRLNATYQAVAAATVAKLTLGTGSGLDFDFTPGGGGASNDTLTVTTPSTGLTLGSTNLNLYVAGGVTPFSENGTYPLISYSTAFSGTLAGAFSVANSVVGKVYSVNNNTGLSLLELVINDSVTAAWNVDGGGTWSVAGNWLPTTVPNSVGAVATFGGAYLGAAPPAVVTLDGSKTVGSLIFSNAASYQIDAGSGGGITVDNGIATAVISATLGSHTVNVPLTLVNPTNINADAGATLTVSGAVGGAGTVTKIGAGTLALSGANTFTGATLLSAGTLDLGGVTPLGGTASLTVRPGTTLRASAAGVTVATPVTLDLNGGAIIALSGAANFAGNYLIDVTGGSALTLTGLLGNTGGSLVKDGPGTLTLTNGGANVLGAGTPAGTSASVRNGTLTLNGGAAATYAVSGEFSIGDNTPNTVTVNLLSGTLNVSNFISVGRGNGTTGLTAAFNITGATVNVPNFYTGFSNNLAGFNNVQAVTVTNGTVTATAAGRLAESAGGYATMDLTGTSTFFTQNNLEIAYGGVARISIGAGATLNANQYLFGNSGGSGAIWNRGTFVIRSGASTNHFAVGNSNGGYGYYLHDTAVPTTLAEIGVGGAGTLNNGNTGFGGSGVLEVRSGTLAIANWVTLNRTNGAAPIGPASMLLLSGGTLTHNIANQFYVNQNVSSPQYASIEVLNTGRFAGGNVSNIDLNRNATVTTNITFTVSNGGTVETTRIFATAPLGNVHVSFNGGTLRATANNTNLLDINLDTVTLYGSGLTVDTAGFNSTLGGNALLAPLGQGITSIPLLTGGARYIGRPTVVILDGTGVGASAIANFNEATGQVTGITITSPGSNYSAPTIQLIGGGASTPATLDVAVLGTVSGGGLIKTGLGTLTINNGTNTYSGNTLVNGGTLLVTNPQFTSATSTGAVNVNNGGTLAGTGFISGLVTVASGGGLTPGNVGVGTLTLGSLTLSSGSIINQQITDTVTGDLISVTDFNGLTINGGGYSLLQTGNGNPYSTNGVYNLIGYQGTIGGLGATALSVLNPQGGKTYAFGENAGFVTLTIATAGGTPNYWLDVNGNWTVGANWSLGTPANGVSAFAVFGGGPITMTADHTVTLNANQTVGSISFNSANSGFNFTLVGTNLLTLDNGLDPNAQITVAQGNHTIAFSMSAVSANTQFNIVNATDSLTVSGALSGTTAVSKLGSGLLTLSGNNSFNGSLSVNAGTLALVGPNGVGNATAVNISNAATLSLQGTITVAAPVNMLIGGGTATSINVGTPDAPANFTINTPTGANATLIGLVTNASGSFVKTGPGTLTLTNAGANTLGTVAGTSVAVRDGTLVINTNGSVASSAEFVIGDTTPNAGVTVTLSAGTLNVPSFISIGRGTGTTGLVQTFNVNGGTVNANNLYSGFDAGVGGYNAVQNITIANAAAVNVSATTRFSESAGSFATVAVNGTASFTTTGDTQVGYGGRAVLNLAGTATVTTGSLQIGFGNNTFGNTAAGVINQTGGTLNVTSSGGQGDIRFGGFNGANDANAYGAYILSGGSFSSGGRNIQVGAFGAGILDIRGGSYTSTGGGFPVVGRFAGGAGLLTLSSGSLSSNGTANLLIIGEAGTGVFTMTGGTATVLANPGGAGNGGGTGGVRLGHVAGGVGLLNLNGGTLQTTGVAKSAAAAVGFLYLNGGTLTAGAANTTFLQGLDAANVGPGGAIFDTNGNNITVAQQLTAPAGAGVVTIPLLSGGSGYLAPPVVTLSGAGQGATAVANLTAGVITSITVTSPGFNYIGAPTVTLRGGGTDTPGLTDDANIVIGANPTTGGLTKTGTGTLTLTADNTYGGPTAVNGGTLLVANTSGSATGFGTVTVAAAGTLRGNGFIGGPVVVAGVIRAGAGSPANTLRMDNGLTVNSGGRIYAEVTDGTVHAAAGTGGSTVGLLPDPTSNNYLYVPTGTTTINGGALITVDGTGATFTAGAYSYQIGGTNTDLSALNITAPSQFTFTNIPFDVTSRSLTGNAAGALFLNFSLAVVPEPTAVLALAGVAILALRRRKA